MQISHQFMDVKDYEVKLTVKDNSNTPCDAGEATALVKINRAPQADAGKDMTICPGETANFDGTRSYIDPKANVVSRWFFGDGQTAEGLKTDHIYAKPGKFQASLSLEEKVNTMCPASRATINVNVNSQPSVQLKSEDMVCLGNKVTFDASAAADPDGDELEYYWSFGDGTILKDGPKITHEYNHGGEYRVTVVVDDKKGSNCSTATATKIVRVNTPPIADAGPNLTCCVEKEAEFNAKNSSDPDGDTLTYIWDFGDGTKADGAVARHEYAKGGNYNVTLTVDDNKGTACSRATAGFVASANASPVPVMTVR
ncbi:MAG: PKD domain-containing protein [Candidatus Omnitrophica bacterium]|nr:PKD domain-containing protein [Candidatus Omnitrophota bacterium]